MGWNFVQSKKFSFASGTSQSGALDTNVIVGNRLVVYAYVYGSGVTLDHVSDNLGNQGTIAGKYDQIFSQSDTFNGHLYALTAPITTGGSCTVTVTASGSASFISFWVGEYSGLSTVTGSAAWDLFVSNGGTIASSMGTGTSAGTVSATGELAVIGFGDTIVSGSTTVTSPGGWVERFNDTAAATDLPLLIDDQTPTAGSTLSWTTSFGGSDAGNGYAAGLVVFKLPPATAVSWIFPPLKSGSRPGIAFTTSPRSTTVPKSATTDVGTRFICAPTITGASLPLISTTGVRGATGGNQRGQHLIYAKNSGRWWFFTYGPVLDSGTATSGTTAALVDATKTWTASAYRAASCLIVRGTGAGQAFEIGPNTSNTLQVYNNGDPAPPQPGLATAPDNTSAYIILETRKVQAFVSSGPNLATATWSEATGSPSPTLPNNSGIDVSGGANDGGSIGSDIPTDGRLLTVGYMDAGGVDVVQLLTNENLHWVKYSERARLGVGSPTTISWDLTGPATWYDSFDSHNEDAPAFPQVTAIRASNTHRWHVLQHQNSLPHSGIIANPSVTDDGTSNLAPAWGGVYSDLDGGDFFAWCGALTPLASGFMLATYTKGTRDSPVGSGISHQTGIRYIESSSESGWPVTPGGSDVPGLSTASNSPNDWDIAAVTTADIHLVRRNSSTVLEHIRYSGHGGSWGSVDTIPSTGLTGHLAGSGIALVTDGQSLWCFVIDTDLNHSIRYIKWKAGAWETAWATLPVGGEYKSFITATWSADTGQAGIAWTANAQQPYAVNYQAFIPPASPGATPQQNFSKNGPYPSLVQDLRATNAPRVVYVDLTTRFTIATTGVADVATRFSVVARPGALLPPDTFHPGKSPGGFTKFLPDSRTRNAPTTSTSDVKTRFLLSVQPGATHLLTTFIGHPGLAGPATTLSFSNDVRSRVSPVAIAIDISTRLSVLATPFSGITGSQVPSVIRPGLQGPFSALNFQNDTRSQWASSSAVVDISLRFRVDAPSGALLDHGTYHPGRSPGGASRFASDIRNANAPISSYANISTRLTISSTPGANLDRGTYHPGRSPGGYSKFQGDIRSANSPTLLASDVKTRLIVDRFVSMGASIAGITLPGNFPKADPSFRQPVKAFDAPVSVKLDVHTRFVVQSSAVTGAVNPYLYVGRLGRSDSQLGNMQLGIDRVIYTGALLAPAGSITDTASSGQTFLIVQPRDFIFQLQNRFLITDAKYGTFTYGNGIYSGGSATIQVQPRNQTLVVLSQGREQGSQG